MKKSIILTIFISCLMCTFSLKTYDYRKDIHAWLSRKETQTVLDKYHNSKAGANAISDAALDILNNDLNSLVITTTNMGEDNRLIDGVCLLLAQFKESDPAGFAVQLNIIKSLLTISAADKNRLKQRARDYFELDVF